MGKTTTHSAKIAFTIVMNCVRQSSCYQAYFSNASAVPNWHCQQVTFSARKLCGKQDVLKWGGVFIVQDGVGERSRGHVSFLEEQPGSPFSMPGPSIFLWPRLGLDESSF